MSGTRGPEESGRPDIDRLLEEARSGEPGAASLEDLSARAHISRFHLSRLLREHLGFPLRDFLAASKVDRGIDVLLEGHDVTRSQVEAGHESASSYHHAFVKHTGVPPSTYRAQMKFLAAHLLRHMDDPAPLAVLHRSFDPEQHQQEFPLTLRVDGAVRGSALFVALNREPILKGAPTFGVALLGATQYEVAEIPDGTYYAMCVEVRRGEGVRPYFKMDGNRRQLIRTPVSLPLAEPLTIALELRDRIPTDPPITPNLPKLFFEGAVGKLGLEVSNSRQAEQGGDA